MSKDAPLAGGRNETEEAPGRRRPGGCARAGAGLGGQAGGSRRQQEEGREEGIKVFYKMTGKKLVGRAKAPGWGEATRQALKTRQEEASGTKPSNDCQHRDTPPQSHQGFGGAGGLAEPHTECN